MSARPWESPFQEYPKLSRDLKVDVAVIGGGITGVTTAYLLKKAGLSVALLEKDRLGSGDTGCTTAHLTTVTDARPARLVREFGLDHAQAVWDAGQAALGQIATLALEESIDCDLHSVPGYLHLPLNEGGPPEARMGLQDDLRAVTEIGFHGSYLENVPLIHTPGLRFGNQAMFDPLRYLAPLAAQIAGQGSYVFEKTSVDEISKDSATVSAGGYRVSYGQMVIATHVPLLGTAGLVKAALFQSKLASYTSYAVQARIPPDASTPALFWDTADPYHYLRIHRTKDQGVAILGGKDHKTGQADNPTERLRSLEKLLRTLISDVQVTHRWSGQVIETNDGLPYIGENAPRQFVSTGFAGNGMTFGTLAAMMARDWVTGQSNPWTKLFDVGRTRIKAGGWDYLKENSDYPYYMLKDHLRFADREGMEGVRPGEGKILNIDGERVAVSRDDAGNLAAVSSTCTHMGCLVHWNSLEKTWDCPCHGSRFKATGEVLAGPAETALEPKPIAVNEKTF